MRVSDLLYCIPWVGGNASDVENLSTIRYVCMSTFDSTDLTRRIDLPLTNDMIESVSIISVKLIHLEGLCNTLFPVHVPTVHPSER